LLSENRAKLPALVTALVRHQVSEEGLEKLEYFRSLARRDDVSTATALERSEREDDLLEWLENHGVAEAWEVAATLNEANLSVADLEDVARNVPEAALPHALAWLGGGISSDQIVEEIKAAAGRISELVASIKTYSHMDRSPEHKPTDVRLGVDNTLKMLGHKVKEKDIRVVREYEDDLPLIPANAGELNQVWTNLLDNAIDAVDQGGELTLRAKLNDLWVEVEIVDDGPGIPEEILSHIFEPFFTTKDVGVGTGLGLGIAMRIVQTHQGHIQVKSRPGETSMCVRLPVERTSPEPG
jgi:signal transduction histidine kinase